MAACDDDSESPSGSGLRSVSSRSFSGLTVPLTGGPFFFGFYTVQKLTGGKAVFPHPLFRGPAGYKAHDEGVLILAFPDLKIDVFPEGLDHFSGRMTNCWFV